VTLYDDFLGLHYGDAPLLIPNPHDQGSARVLAGLGFRALATTSGGFAASLGRRDYGITRDEALEHAASIVGAVSVPVSADLENGFGDEVDDVVRTVRGAIGAGLAGCSIEDSTRTGAGPIYDKGLAVDRIAAAVEAAHGGPARLVLTARAENFLWGIDDLDDTISRLQAYADAGADVLYAPGLVDPDDIAAVVKSVDKPVNVLLLNGGPTVAELAELGVHRISVGGHFANIAYGAVAAAAAEFLDGRDDFLARSAQGRDIVNQYFA
jgi:2-methylisocitrate lyase-like PEP mutase family enzyme